MGVFLPVDSDLIDIWSAQGQERAAGAVSACQRGPLESPFPLSPLVPQGLWQDSPEGTQLHPPGVGTEYLYEVRICSDEVRVICSVPHVNMEDASRKDSRILGCTVQEMQVCIGIRRMRTYVRRITSRLPAVLECAEGDCNDDVLAIANDNALAGQNFQSIRVSLS